MNTLTLRTIEVQGFNALAQQVHTMGCTPRTEGEVGKEAKENWMRLERVSGISGELMVLEGKKASVYARARDTEQSYTTGTSAAPKGKGMNDAAWILDHNAPWSTRVSVDGEIKEIFNTPIHGWPSFANGEFDDDEERHTFHHTESRGNSGSKPPMLPEEGREEADFLCNSPVQAKAMSALYKVCKLNNVPMTAFTEQQIAKFVKTFMAKYEVAENTTTTLSRFK